jgi:endoglucanase
MKIPVRYNHVGYAPESAKIFFVNAKELSYGGLAVDACFFRIVKNDHDLGCSLEYEGRFREGSFEHGGACGYSGELLWSGDFSTVREPGDYTIQIRREDRIEKEILLFETAPFEISDGWIYRQLLANIKSFYYQRSGVELLPEFAGKWTRPMAHRDDAIGFHPSMQREGMWNAHGGWYDAGDYGKYIVNGGVSVAALLLACELAEESLGAETEPCRNQLREALLGGGAETGDGLKQYSLKDEVRFELEFFLRMQDEDGGVFFKVTPEHWDGFISPKESDSLQKRMILGKSTTSTLNFAGVMAAAYRVYRGSDAAFAERCLQSAVSAYRWAVARPFVDWPHNTEGSGGYGDEHAEDEFFWARAMLYRELQTRGSIGGLTAAELRPQLLEDMEKLPPKFGVDWRDTQNLGWIGLALQDQDDELRNSARRTLEKTAADIIEAQKHDAYGISLSKFIWGSNGEIANHALTLAVVKRWKKDTCLDGACGSDCGENVGGGEREARGNGLSLDFWCRELLNFIYGRNPVDVSFVTGSAWSSPKFPHHRLSHSDGVIEPIPGLLVGGINSDRQDMHRAPHYPGELAGFSYTDEQCSFASNETAINWNAPLTAVLALLCC